MYIVHTEASRVYGILDVYRLFLSSTLSPYFFNTFSLNSRKKDKEEQGGGGGRRPTKIKIV